VDGALAKDVEGAVIDHVSGCGICQGLAEKYKATFAAPREIPWPIAEESARRVIAGLIATLRSAPR
jgi:hypothetical protein